jgi:3',5'-cyclic-AMP phosphodiesterase
VACTALKLSRELIARSTSVNDYEHSIHCDLDDGQKGAVPKMSFSSRSVNFNAIMTWLHIGDLHTVSAEEENYTNLCRIVQLIKDLSERSIDFIFLPGDNADDGTAEQFALVHEAVSSLTQPIHILPGDHDFHSGSLQAFHAVLHARTLPYGATIQGRRCLFLDVVSAGTGGTDFRLNDNHLDWVEREVKAAAADNQTVAIFMHTYPADLQTGAERLQFILSHPKVLCVDMGHTHYNELSNDGNTIYMATRSTGQIEEGPAGFSLGALDGDNVSWRFKSLAEAWPFVLITAPVDHRLATVHSYQLSGKPVCIHAKAIGDAPIKTVDASIDDGPWQPMHVMLGEDSVWELQVPRAENCIRVRARDWSGREDEDMIELANLTRGVPLRVGEGSDADRISEWPERGILGTQLGPNRNGRKW